MIITHAIIKQKFHEQIEKRQKRKAELQDVSEILIKKYKESLSTPSDLWEDANGYPRNYVSTGIRNGKGLFQPASISSIDIDKDFVFSFIISTVIDEIKCDNVASAEVAISIYKQAGSYYILVGDKKSSFRVVTVTAADAFNNVNNAIKEAVIELFADPRLDY
ncbi:hypothetical protein ACOJBQ_003539 [Cronobacter muytjensii]|uniref:hypothetical protein n=1 Tax=Cronobacter muytjensii TaxID=413501 RepID=UPI0034D5662C